LMMQASFALMMSSVALSMVKAEAHIQAAKNAKTPAEHQKHSAAAGGALAQAWAAVGLMSLGLAAKVVAKIPVPKRLQVLQKRLRLARAAVANNVGQGWKAIRTRAIDEL